MNPAATPTTIFISHTVSDKKIADAFNEAVQKLLGDSVTVAYSTSLDHGPKHGDQWLPWIHQQVRDSRITIILITPSSIRKPWILWEAGAVSGTSIASGNSDSRKVRPVIFRMTPDQIPDPFKDTQIIAGDEYEPMYSVFAEWVTETLKPSAIAKAIGKLPSVLQAYLATVNSELDNAPLIPTEAVVQEWQVRLDELRAQNRTSEVRSLHDWLNIAFGRSDDTPLDIRLHRRLGELYLDARSYDEAARQLELARQISPRDIFVLRELARARLGLKQNEKVAEIISTIEKLDPMAFERNVECAALKGRWCRDADSAAALEVYRKAFQHNPKSYYMGDLLGQMQLQLGDTAAARKTYARVLEIINALAERNLWVQATAANAAIVSGAEPAVVKEKLRTIGSFDPSSEDLRAIEDGLKRVQKALGFDDATHAEWVAALR